MKARAVMSAAMLVLMAACGSSSHAKKVDVTVSIDGAQHVCKVALSQEAQASSVACAELLPFLRDELRLPGGAVYELRGDQTVDPSQLASVAASLKSAGYRLAP